MKNRKTVVPLALLLLVPIVAMAIAYTVFTIQSQVTVHEPLSVTGISITDTSSGNAGSCSQPTSSSITCSLSVYAGESGSIRFTINNAASVNIIPAVQATSNDSTNVPLTISPIPKNGVPAGGSLPVTVSFTVSQSTPLETVTITITVSR